LYDGGRTQANVRAAEAALASAQAAVRQTEQDTALSVATSFFNVLQAERLATVREALLLQAQAQLALSQARVRAGVTAQSDVIQAQAQVAQAQVDLLAARSQIGTAKAGLQGSLGADPAAPVELQEPLAPTSAVTATAEAVMQAAETTRPEVARAQATVDSDQAALDVARVAAGPQVSVGLGTTYTPLSTSPILNNATSYGISATVSLPLYDSGKGGAEIAAAQATLQSAQAQLRAQRLAVRQDAYQAYLSAVQAAANIQATQAAKAAADEALRVAEGRYRAGVGIIVELITARAQAAQADVNAVNALYAYETSLATLRHAEGMPIQASALGGGQ
jgi:outer membrane protein